MTARVGAATAWAPGRVNLIGDHTDYNGGLVLPMAIHLGTTATVESIEELALLLSSGHRSVVRLPLGAVVPRGVDGWSAYVAGTVWALGLADRGWRIDVDGDVPLGAGLSSSASLEAAVAVALLDAAEVAAPPREIARSCQRAENVFVGVPTGAMDQVAAVMSQAGSALLFDVGLDAVRPVDLTALLADNALLVLDTGVAHELASGEYRVRRAQCDEAAELLGIPTLSDVDDLSAALTALDDPSLRARVRHVVSENERVRAAVEALETGDCAAFGRLMSESHASLRDDYAVSCRELDEVVDAALARGALGARMTGGGFGGSAVALVPRDRVDAVIIGTPAARVIDVTPGGGAHIIR